jgi:hypothetical protein
LSNCLKVELGRQTRSEQMRVADTLRRLGWTKESAQKQKDGKRRQVWVRPEQLEAEPEPQIGDTQPVHEQNEDFDDWEPALAPQLLQVGDRVVCKKEQGVITRLDGGEAFIEGKSFLDWVALSELTKIAAAVALNGTAGP